MGAPWSQMDRKAEDAFKGVIAAQVGENLTGIQIVRGQEALTNTLPRIEIICEEAQIERAGDSDYITGNYFCQMIVRLVTNYEDTDRDTRAAMMSELFDMLMATDIVELLNNQGGVADFTALGGGLQDGQGEGWMPERIASLVDEHSIISELRGTLYCMPHTSEDQ